MIRILLIDDHAAFRQPLAFMLEREPDIAVVGQAGTIKDARDILENVDVAVVDLDLPDGNGALLIPELRAASPDGRVMVLTASGSDREAADAIEAGASAVLRKSVGIAEIIDAVRRLSAGEALVALPEQSALLRRAAAQREQDRAAMTALNRLTPREREVLQSLADGLNDKEIAQRLGVSPETVRTHVVNILGKLNVHSRLQAVIFAVRHGEIRFDDR